MQKNVLSTDLTGKTAVVTGAGGVLCSAFSQALARAGAKVALLDLNFDAAKRFADKITAEGGIAKAYQCTVLDKAACFTVADEVERDLGKCDILVNGAGGNSPKATTDKEYFETLTYEEKQRYTLSLSEKYLRALERFRKESEFAVTNASARL